MSAHHDILFSISRFQKYIRKYRLRSIQRQGRFKRQWPQQTTTFSRSSGLCLASLSPFCSDRGRVPVRATTSVGPAASIGGPSSVAGAMLLPPPFCFGKRRASLAPPVPSDGLRTLPLTQLGLFSSSHSPLRCLASQLTSPPYICHNSNLSCCMGCIYICQRGSDSPSCICVQP
jgi:hypothetical protein